MDNSKAVVVTTGIGSSLTSKHFIDAIQRDAELSLYPFQERVLSCYAFPHSFLPTHCSSCNCELTGNEWRSYCDECRTKIPKFNKETHRKFIGKKCK